jgi:adhesin transport system membrane fusion protein
MKIDMKPNTNPEDRGAIAARIEHVRSWLMGFFKADEDISLMQHLMLAFIALFFVVFILWANFATLEEVTRGEGKVIPSGEVQALQSLDAGIVEEFLVAEGDEVAAGQVLLRLSDIEASSDLGANKARYLGLLAAIKRLQAEAEGQEQLDFPDEVKEGAPESVSEEMNAFLANRQQIEGQLNILRQQVRQREQEVTELNTRIGDVRGVLRLLQEARARIGEVASSAQAKAQEELAAKLREMNEIKERLSALTERKTRTELKSPVNGIVQDITVNTIGGVVRPGEDLIRIVPRDDQLIVEAKIKPSDRAFIYPGQQAVIKITAYDFSIYGSLKGEVLDISADTFTQEDGQSFYRVRLRTHETELKRKGEVLPIIPGMVAQVDILTGEKTVMQYLMKPFIKTLDNAMSER